MIQEFYNKAEITANDEEVVFLTPKNVAEMMNCSLVSARQLFHRKDFPSIRIEKNFKVMKSAFIKWCEEKHE
ncbi:DNA-binding protein [Eubacterium sp.]|uniref:DNA-binding protein n=1 Tax=uncultured Eubacterium sp. TaxID=165185 RepID=UPI0025F77FF4|nr:DNA-binding protein [uncultured Eubacterium sp.]